MTKRHIQFKKDPTSAIKRKIISKLNELEKQACIGSKLKHQLHLTSEYFPCFYGLLKINKDDVPLCPIVSRVGSVTYDIAKFLAFVL